MPQRILMAKPGLDGHDRGAKVIARALVDAGFEVIYTGLHQTPEGIVNSALQEGVDLIGLSIMSGAHLPLTARICELLRQAEVQIPLLVGGIIPEPDRATLKELGVAEVFTPGSELSAIVDCVKSQLGGP